MTQRFSNGCLHYKTSSAFLLNRLVDSRLREKSGNRQIHILQTLPAGSGWSWPADPGSTTALL